MAAARSILVSFAAKPHIDDVEQMLRKFGYHVCILANDVWLEDRVDESLGPMVLLLAGKDFPCRDIVRRLEITTSMPSLAAVHCQEIDCRSAFLECCDEFP